MILIIGAGLSGLLTAYRLKNKGIPFKLLEARNRVGGRINTLYRENNAPVEMGATWFGKQHKELISLLEELELNTFEQHMEGSVFFQPFSTAAAQSIQIPSQAPSYRIAGGSAKLIQTLYEQLDSEDVLLNQRVKEINNYNGHIEVKTHQLFKAEKVVLCIPPKLWAKKISFSPSLEEDLNTIAQSTHTWMEDSIKLAIGYKNAFWENENNSGALFSNTGPITEFYDHSNEKRSAYALCGFVSGAFKALSFLQRKETVLKQLENVYGKKALDFTSYDECIWSNETETYIASETALYPHQNNGNPIFRAEYFQNKLFISGSETAENFPGYMDGAVATANENVKKIMTFLV